jgi:hypothetical protein
LKGDPKFTGNCRGNELVMGRRSEFSSWGRKNQSLLGCRLRLWLDHCRGASEGNALTPRDS